MQAAAHITALVEGVESGRGVRGARRGAREQTVRPERVGGPQSARAPILPHRLLAVVEEVRAALLRAQAVSVVGVGLAPVAIAGHPVLGIVERRVSRVAVAVVDKVAAGLLIVAVEGVCHPLERGRVAGAGAAAAVIAVGEGTGAACTAFPRRLAAIELRVGSLALQVSKMLSVVVARFCLLLLVFQQY